MSMRASHDSQRNHNCGFNSSSRVTNSRSKMNKENVADVQGTSGGMSEEQRARISQKFRAAKALLSCKRPRHSTPYTSLQFPQKRVPRFRRPMRYRPY